MNFRLWLESVTGEYWINEYGEAQYCDGDICDQNHES